MSTITIWDPMMMILPIKTVVLIVSIHSPPPPGPGFRGPLKSCLAENFTATRIMTQNSWEQFSPSYISSHSGGVCQNSNRCSTLWIEKDNACVRVCACVCECACVCVGVRTLMYKREREMNLNERVCAWLMEDSE